MAETNGRPWPLPASEIIDDPIYGKGVRYNFALNHRDEDLIRHRGQFVAWSMDGTKVLASAATGRDLMAEADRLKLDPDEYIISRVPDDV